MKGKIGLFAALVAVGTGLVAPTVEAGRTTLTQCTYVKVGSDIQISGQIDGIRWVTTDQAGSSLYVKYTDNTYFGVSETPTWTQTGRTTGTYEQVGVILDYPVQSVVWTIMSTRNKLIASITCT